MLCTELFFRPIERDGFPAFKLFHAMSDGSQGFGALQALEHDLVAFGVLDDEFGSAVNGEDKRRFVLFEPANIVLDVALKLGNGANLSQVDHPGNPPIMHKADNSTLA